MKILLDTHIVLWSLFASGRLSHQQSGILIDKNNEIFVSAVTVWEISLKFSLGKLDLPGIKPDRVPHLIEKAGFKSIDLTNNEVANFFELPVLTHKDPFDRMLIWQAIQRGLYFMSHDPAVHEYQRFGLKVI